MVDSGGIDFRLIVFVENETYAQSMVQGRSFQIIIIQIEDADNFGN
jgi:hypothetical protein